MNIIEAVKSGKRFKNPRMKYWIFESCSPQIILTRPEIIAEDWEIEEEKIEITKDQLHSLANNLGVEHYVIKELLRKLGFKD